MSNSPFQNQICILTGKKINLNNINPVIKISPKYSSLFSNREKNFNIALTDVANLVNNILLRREEYNNANLDKRGRFDRNKSILVKNGLDQTPIVDELILDVIKQLGLKVRDIWPDCKKCAVCLTHDVDIFDGKSYFWLRKVNWYLQALKSLLKSNKDKARDWMSKIKKWSKRTDDPWYAFDKWMEIEDRYGFKSTFYFFGFNKALSREGRKYSCKDKKVKKILRKLHNNGWEVGLHAGYHNHLKLKCLIKQKNILEETLGAEVKGCRQHYLRVRFPASWRLYNEAGFTYSSNLGWTGGYNGFRAGTCWPYKPINYEKGKRYAIWEVPFQIIDRPYIENPEGYLNLFRGYLRFIKEINGVLVINFHQQYFSEEVASGVNTAYRLILEELKNDREVYVNTIYNVLGNLEKKLSNEDVGNRV